MIRSTFLLFIIFFGANANALQCVDDNLVWQKLIITKNAESSYQSAIEALSKAAATSTTGEAEFYQSAIEFRLGLEQESKVSMEKSTNKKYYLSSAFMGLAYELGVAGYSKSQKKANEYYSQFLTMASECSEGNAASFSSEEAAMLVAKLFGILPDLHNKNEPREKLLPSISCAKVLRKASFYVKKNKIEKAKKLLSESIGGKCDTPYDLFNANRFLGFVLYAEGKLALSIEAYLAAQLYRFEDGKNYIDGFYTVSQLYYVHGEYEKSIAQAKEYFVLKRELAPEQVILMATSYYELEQYNEALKYTLQGMQLAELIKQDIPKVWYELLWNIYFDSSDYNSAISTTRVMVQTYPEGKYQKRYAILCKKISDHKYCS